MRLTYIGESLKLLTYLKDSSINLILTSPPFALTRKKEYGNESVEKYIEWFLPSRVLTQRVLLHKCYNVDGFLLKSMRIILSVVDTDLKICKFFCSWVESMGSIICRTSLLDPDVRLSVHPAPDVLGFLLAHVMVLMAGRVDC